MISGLYREKKIVNEYSPTFNGSKSQFMIFGGGQHQCDIYVGGIRLILSHA